MKLNFDVRIRTLSNKYYILYNSGETTSYSLNNLRLAYVKNLNNMKNLFKLPYLTVLCFGFSCDTELEKANPLENLNISNGLVTEVESFSATIKGVISTNEFNGVENYGHCWSISENPTIEDNCTFLGEIQASNYEFLSFIENLDIEENYF